MSKKIIDLSVWNKNYKIDWKTVKENTDGVIIRIGYRGYRFGTLKIDSLFTTYATQCVKYDIPFGVYWFAQEITEKESVESAQFIANILKDYKIDYPVYYDVEYSGATNNSGRADKLTKRTRTNCIIAFCNEIKRFGYVSGVYANEEWFNTMIDFDKIKNYSIWCARWNNDNGKVGQQPFIKYDLWQYTSKGTIKGIKGKVDISLSNNSFNNTNDNDDYDIIKEVALDVINGKYGNGIIRKNKLKKAGFDYNIIQSKVNEIIKNYN